MVNVFSDIRISEMVPKDARKSGGAWNNVRAVQSVPKAFVQSILLASDVGATTVAQLRAEMARAEELATTRERTRIAHDIHDVLAHSLSILSIQMQAARQLVSRDPERLAAVLAHQLGLA